jgi:predicted XRE-type DNA-binding protein
MLKLIVAQKLLEKLIGLGLKRTGKPPREECLIWPYSKEGCGYARINNKKISVSGIKTKLVSRLICQAVYGDPPPEKPDAIHSCDCGHLGCVEPSHLAWGSKFKNNGPDKLRAGTDCNGEKHSNHKLTTKQVRCIQKLYASNCFTQRELGTRFGVSQNQIKEIVNFRQRKIA